MKNEQDPLYKLRHTSAHVLAAVLKKLYPDIQLAIGPAIENGFYYDVDSPVPITDKDLPKIEKAMKEFIKKGAEMVGTEVSAEEAKQHFDDAPYKLELIEEFAEEGQTLTEYGLGEFVDLCKGGHLKNADEINPHAIKLTHIAGAYWRGDENNKMLTRIYGLAFETREDLKKHLMMLEEAKKRDHRKIGEELDLWTFSDLVGPGLPLFTQRGTVMRQELEKLIAELQEPHGYQRVWTPHITKPELYKASGHWDKFADDIFHVRGKNDAEFVMKPMNCPHHTQIYKSRLRSYRELPIRYAEFGTVYRDENAGQLQGLTRVRSITQDDAHAFCRKDQIVEVILGMIDITEKVYELYGMTLEPMLSTRDKDQKTQYLGADQQWEDAEEELKTVLQKHYNGEYKTDVGGAAFYGPKIDLWASDAIGRKWQLATFQIDFGQPEGLDLTYVDKTDAQTRPFMIHRAILGSIERHLGVITEHFAGNFPLWLSPVQVAVLSVSEKHHEHAQKLVDELSAAGIRAEIDDSDETVGRKIRANAKQKIPYIIVYGDKEIESGVLPIRVRGKDEQVEMPVKDFIDQCVKRIAERTQDL